MSSIPTEETHPYISPDEVNFLRLKWRSEKDDFTSVEKCECFNPPLPHGSGDARYHLTISGERITGHFNYDANWYMLVGAQAQAAIPEEVSA